MSCINFTLHSWITNFAFFFQIFFLTQMKWGSSGQLYRSEEWCEHSNYHNAIQRLENTLSWQSLRINYLDKKIPKVRKYAVSCQKLRIEKKKASESTNCFIWRYDNIPYITWGYKFFSFLKFLVFLLMIYCCFNLMIVFPICGLILCI